MTEQKKEIQLPKFIQNKNQLLSESAVQTLKEKLSTLSAQDWYKITGEAVFSKYDTISRVLSSAGKEVTDDAIRIYLPTLLALFGGSMILGGIIGYYAGRKK